MGRQEFAQIATVVPREQLIYAGPAIIGLNTIAAGGSVEWYMNNISTNVINKICGIFIDCVAPAGATSGSHKIEISLNYQGPVILSATANYNQNLVINYCDPGALTIVPSDKLLWADILRNVYFQRSMPFYFKYTNNTNVSSQPNPTTGRRFEMHYLQKEVQ